MRLSSWEKTGSLKVPYPVDPDKTQKEPKVQEDVQDIPTTPPEPQSGPSVSHQGTQGLEHQQGLTEVPPALQTPHPDPEAKDRDRAICSYFEKGGEPIKNL